ncbi:MAG: fatty acid desaturase [Oligoflexia bacterium]|nr:fatty acid desaturase [Oligoflexia bacterium]
MSSLSTKKIDYKTLLILLLQIAGSSLACILYYFDYLSVATSILLGIVSMNLSFTPWHEASHKNLSTNSTINSFVGILSSLFSIYPAYFSKKREHLIHHKFAGDEQFDPVYPRIQTNFWLFLPNLIFRILSRKEKIQYNGLKLRKKEIFLDTIHYTLILCFLAISIYYQFFSALLYGLLIPRIFVFILHAIYICYFPHSKSDGGFIISKTPSTNLILFYLTLGQSAHGIHHENPNIAWHSLLAVAKKRGRSNE